MHMIPNMYQSQASSKILLLKALMLKNLIHWFEKDTFSFRKNRIMKNGVGSEFQIQQVTGSDSRSYQINKFLWSVLEYFASTLAGGILRC